MQPDKRLFPTCGATLTDNLLLSLIICLSRRWKAAWAPPGLCATLILMLVALFVLLCSIIHSCFDETRQLGTSAGGQCRRFDSGNNPSLFLTLLSVLGNCQLFSRLERMVLRCLPNNIYILRYLRDGLHCLCQ